MPLLYGGQWKLTWKIDSSPNNEFSAKVDVPIARAAGANVNADASAGFKASVDQFWEFGKLDT